RRPSDLARHRDVVGAQPALQRLDHPRVHRQRAAARLRPGEREERRGRVRVPQHLTAEPRLLDPVRDDQLGARRRDADLQTGRAAERGTVEPRAGLLEQDVGRLLREREDEPARVVVRLGEAAQLLRRLARERRDREPAGARRVDPQLDVRPRRGELHRSNGTHATSGTETPCVRGADRRGFHLMRARSVLVALAAVLALPAAAQAVPTLDGRFAVSGTPGRIAAGPDGNVWFTLGGTKELGRITPAGVVTEFDLPKIPTSLTAGPGNKLWLPYTGGVLEWDIASETPTEHPIAQINAAEGIVRDPMSGSFWVVDPSDGGL